MCKSVWWNSWGRTGSSSWTGNVFTKQSKEQCSQETTHGHMQQRWVIRNIFFSASRISLISALLQSSLGALPWTAVRLRCWGLTSCCGSCDQEFLQLRSLAFHRECCRKGQRFAAAPPSGWSRWAALYQDSPNSPALSLAVSRQILNMLHWQWLHPAIQCRGLHYKQSVALGPLPSVRQLNSARHLQKSTCSGDIMMGIQNKEPCPLNSAGQSLHLQRTCHLVFELWKYNTCKVKDIMINTAMEIDYQ